MPRAPRQRPPSPEAPRWTDPAPPRRRGRARPAQPVWGYGADNITTQFVQQFAEAEERERRPRKDPRTAERHAALRKQLSQVSFTPPLALSTKVNMAISLKRWQTYCDLILGLRDWKQALKTTDSKTAIDYLVYMLDSCDIKSSGTSWQYFRQWKQVYYLTLKEEFPKYESDQVRHFHDTIAVAEFHLESPKKREKTVTDSDDLLALLSFNIAYDSHALPSERQRLDVAACYLLLAYTGCRPAELVDGEKKKPKDGTFEELFGQGGVMPEPREGRDDDGDDNELARMLERDTALRRRPKALCYEDIQLMVVPHPKTGRDTLTMSIKFTHHKGSDNKPKPTIFFFTPTKKLLFCVVTLVVSLAILDGAFESPYLHTVGDVFGVKNQGPVTSTTLRWKEEWRKRPVFRKHGGDLDTPLPYRTLHDYMGNQSLDMGYEKRIGPKDWRRNVGNTVNEQASEPVLDQIMRHHAGSDTFRSSYLNQKVQFDVQNAVLGEPLETQLLSMLSHVGHLRDPRASSNMVPKEVWAQLPPDSEIVGLQQRRALLKGAGLGVKDSSHKEEIDRLTARINALGGRRRKAVRAWYRKWYFDNRPTWDLARQAHGEAPVGNDKPEIDVQLRPRARLAELLCDQPDDLGPEELSARRVEVGNHMVDLGRLREGMRPEIESFLASYSAAPNAASQPPAPDFDDLARGGSLSFAGAHSHISN